MNLTIIPTNVRTGTVDPYNFHMCCEFEFYEADEGTPASGQLLSCKVGGVEIFDMLSPAQIDRVETALIEQAEMNLNCSPKGATWHQLHSQP